MSSRADRRRHVLALSRRERWVAVIVATVTILVMVAGILVTRFAFDSPEQQDARARTMDRPAVTAEVTRGQRQERVVLRGEVGFSRTIPVAPPSLDGAPAVLVDLPLSRGDEVSAGTVLADVSGAPIIAMPGSFPLYRDLRVGMTGRDVEAVQKALRETGHFHGKVNGRFGADTRTALEALLTDRRLSTDLLRAPTTDTAPAGDPASNPDEEQAGGSGGAAEDATILPRGLFVMVPQLPATVLDTPFAVGSEIPEGEAVMTLSSGETEIVADISTAQAVGVTAGLGVDIMVGAEARKGEVASIEQRSDADGLSTVRVTPQEPLDRELVGQSAEVDIVTRSTEPDALTVPVGAVRSDAKGGTYVLFAADGDEPQRVTVTVLDTVDGAAVLAETDDLPDGSRVLIGSQTGGATRVRDASPPPATHGPNGSDGGAG